MLLFASAKLYETFYVPLPYHSFHTINWAKTLEEIRYLAQSVEMDETCHHPGTSQAVPAGCLF